MAVVPVGNKAIIRLIKAFGLDVDKIVSFKLTIEPDEVVTIEAEIYPSEEDIENGAIAWEAVSKKYELVEKKEKSLEEVILENDEAIDEFLKIGKKIMKS